MVEVGGGNGRREKDREGGCKKRECDVWALLVAVGMEYKI
jgi:hypothetical protein